MTVGLPEGAELASQSFCGTSSIKTYRADPHKSGSDPNQSRRRFPLVGGLRPSNRAIDCRHRGGCLCARGRRNGITSSLRSNGPSERRSVGAIIESGV